MQWGEGFRLIAHATQAHGPLLKTLLAKDPNKLSDALLKTFDKKCSQSEGEPLPEVTKWYRRASATDESTSASGGAASGTRSSLLLWRPSQGLRCLGAASSAIPRNDLNELLKKAELKKLSSKAWKVKSEGPRLGDNLTTLPCRNVRRRWNILNSALKDSETTSRPT